MGANISNYYQHLAEMKYNSVDFNTIQLSV